MLAMIEIGWEALDKIKKDRTIYEALRVGIPQFGMTEWKEDAEDCPYFYPSQTLIDLQTDGMLLSAHDIPFEIKRFKGAYKPAGIDGHGNTYNLQVAIPNVCLMSYNEVMLADDYCTDALQGRLDEGWRVIAVCPPQNCRRPDYILGRVNPKRGA